MSKNERRCIGVQRSATWWIKGQPITDLTSDDPAVYTELVACCLIQLTPRHTNTHAHTHASRWIAYATRCLCMCVWVCVCMCTSHRLRSEVIVEGETKTAWDIRRQIGEQSRISLLKIRILLNKCDFDNQFVLWDLTESSNRLVSLESLWHTGSQSLIYDRFPISSEDDFPHRNINNFQIINDWK